MAKGMLSAMEVAELLKQSIRVERAEFDRSISQLNSTISILDSGHCACTICSKDFNLIFHFFAHLSLEHREFVNKLSPQIRIALPQLCYDYHDAQDTPRVLTIRLSETTPEWSRWPKGDLKQAFSLAAKKELLSRYEFCEKFLRSTDKEGGQVYTCPWFCPNNRMKNVGELRYHFLEYHVEEFKMLAVDAKRELLDAPSDTALSRYCGKDFCLCGDGVDGMQHDMATEEGSMQIASACNGAIDDNHDHIRDKQLKSSTINGQKQSDEKDLEIPALKKKVTELEVQIQALNEHASAQAATQKETTAKLVADAKREAEEESKSLYWPLLEVGVDVILRKHQWSMSPSERDTDIIDRGDVAAHHGSLQADISLFHPKLKHLIPHFSKFETSFQKIYGVSYDWAEKYKDCEQIETIINWRAFLFDDIRHSLPYTLFGSNFDRCVTIITTIGDVKLVAEECKKGEMSIRIKSMEEKYNSSFAANRQYHRGTIEST